MEFRPLRIQVTMAGEKIPDLIAGVAATEFIVIDDELRSR